MTLARLLLLPILHHSTAPQTPTGMRVDITLDLTIKTKGS